MKKVQIIIRHNGDEYVSSIKELSEEQISAVNDEIINAASGRIDYLVINTSNQELYFPKSILLNSVIALIYEKE